MTEEPPLLVQEEHGILIATLNRPAKLNATTREMTRLFGEAVVRFRDTPALKVMLIRATGKYFSAGGDLKQDNVSGDFDLTIGSGIREMHRRGGNGSRRIYDEMEAIEKPFVVAHHARCVGGGLEMSLSCDFRLASSNASYSFPEGLFGVLPATNGVSRLTRVVGPAWARYLVMANMVVDAETARTMGLVQAVYPPETFEANVMDFCRHLAKQDGEQMGAAKLAIEMACDLGLTQASSLERMVNSSLMQRREWQERFTSYVGNIGGKPDTR